MRIDRLEGDTEIGRDLLGGESFGDQLEDFSLTLCEHGDTRRSAIARSRDGIDDLLCDRRR